MAGLEVKDEVVIGELKNREGNTSVDLNVEAFRDAVMNALKGLTGEELTRSISVEVPSDVDWEGGEVGARINERVSVLVSLNGAKNGAVQNKFPVSVSLKLGVLARREEKAGE